MLPYHPKMEAWTTFKPERGTIRGDSVKQSRSENNLGADALLKQQHRDVVDYSAEGHDAVDWGKQPPSLLPADVVTAG